MTTANTANDDLYGDEWWSAVLASPSYPLTDEEWEEYAHFPIEDEYTERDYLVSYYDMGVYGEQIVRASDEEFAIDGFLTNYQSKTEYAPYVARCETLHEAKERIAEGDTALPEDGQFERYGDFRNAYYEALNN